MPLAPGLPTTSVVPPHHAPAALFVVVLKMQFVLGCLCGVMFSASALVLSLDRSVGGRLVGGLMFMSTVLSGTILGGALVSRHCSKCCMGARAGGSGTAEVCAASWRRSNAPATLAWFQSTLAWLARGAGQGLSSYVPANIDDTFTVAGNELAGWPLRLPPLHVAPPPPLSRCCR